jgi:cytochrome c oxidase subunit 3
VFSVLAADILFFAVLVAIFFARRAGAPMDAGARGTNGDWRRLLPPHIVYLNTVWLLLSSLTMEMARRNIFREIDALEEWLGLGHPALRRCLPWLGATLALGALFLAGQSMAWRQLGARGEVIGQAAIPDGYFYLITGLHAAHLLLGALAIMVCMTALGLLRRIELRQIAVDAVAWFWQTMCGVWLLLFAALALGQ